MNEGGRDQQVNCGNAGKKGDFGEADEFSTKGKTGDSWWPGCDEGEEGREGERIGCSGLREAWEKIGMYIIARECRARNGWWKGEVAVGQEEIGLHVIVRR